MPAEVRWPLLPLRRECMAVFHNLVQGATASGLRVVVGCLKGMFGRASRNHKLTGPIISLIPEVFWTNEHFSQTLPTANKNIDTIQPLQYFERRRMILLQRIDFENKDMGIYCGC
ncbi:MAG: hypothetical protein GY801_05505 [bacterium]|nr:hypothetical protein [bacterium]